MDNPTLKRFFVLHFLLPLLLIIVTVIHLALLHVSGSTNPLGVCSKMDFLRFYPKYISKDIFGFILLVGALVLVIVF